MPFMAGIGANMLGLAYNIMNPLDYSDFNAYRAMAEKSGNYKGVQATPRPGYLAYRPIDREWENRQIQA
jgi:hypothetical protein